MYFFQWLKSARLCTRQRRSSVDNNDDNDDEDCREDEDNAGE